MRDVIENSKLLRTTAADLGLAALISLIIVLPFVILQFLNQSLTSQNAPGVVILFGLLWILPTVFFFVMIPIVRNVRAGRGVMADPLILLLRIASMALIAVMWTSLVVDQLPCFLGVPNCD